MAEDPDVLDGVLGIAPGSRLDGLRRARPDVRLRTETSYRALFAPADPKGLSRAERFLVAAHVATLHESEALAEHYRAEEAEADPGLDLVGAAQDGDAGGHAASRVRALLHHADLLSLSPADGTKADIEALKAAGLDTSAIVTLSQVLAYVSYQVRAAAALALLEISA